MPTREKMQALAQEIVRSYENRLKRSVELREGEAQRQRTTCQEIAQRRRGLASQLRGYGQARAAMSRELRGKLSQENARRRMNLASQLRGYGQAHAAMSRELLTGLSQGEARRRRGVASQLQGHRDVRAGGWQEWQKLFVTMAARRGGAVAAAQPIAPAPAREVARGAPQGEVTEEIEEEQVVARAVVGEVTDEFTRLSERVFEYLANHPDGTRLAELEHEFGMYRFQAARVVRHLMDEGKVEKYRLLYLAV